MNSWLYLSDSGSLHVTWKLWILDSKILLKTLKIGKFWNGKKQLKSREKYEGKGNDYIEDTSEIKLKNGIRKYILFSMK